MAGIATKRGMLRGSPRRLLRLGSLALLAISQGSCVLPAQLRYEQRLETAGKPLQHGIHSERLQQIMQSMALLVANRLPQEMDVQRERRERVDDIVEVSRAMALTADSIADFADEAEMGDASRGEFLRLARSLRDRSLELSERAPGLTLAETRQEFAAIDVTCAECHVRFRLPPASILP